jgi:hypothetical protein
MKMTKLRVQAQHRLNFRFLSRKSHSSGVKFLPQTPENEQKRSSENDASGSKVESKHLSAITILPRTDSSLEGHCKPSTSEEMENQSSDSSETKNTNAEATGGDCDSQEAIDVLRRILEKQRPNSTEVYSISGCAIRIEVLEDTEL